VRKGVHRPVAPGSNVGGDGVRLELVPFEVAVTPACAECDTVWLPADPERWRLRLDIDDVPVWFCPDGDEREFGET
jgi:hypothetical protein